MSTQQPLSVDLHLRRLGQEWSVIALAAALSGAAAGGAHLLRPDGFAAQVELAIGGTGPDAELVPPEELARQFSSPRQVLQLAGVKPAEIDLTRIETEGAVVPHVASAVSLLVRAPDEALAWRLASQAADGVVRDHAERLAEMRALREERLTDLRRLGAVLESSIAEPTVRPLNAQEAGAPASSLLVLDRDASTQALLEVAKLEAQLKADREEPAARGTHVIAGPEIEQVAPFPGLAATVLLGAIAGGLIAALIVVLRGGAREDV